MKKIGVYAGSFDPPTCGHLWMMQQGAALFDELVVVTATNPEKRGFLTAAQKREALLSMRSYLSECVRFVDLPEGFLVDYAHDIGARFLLRGVRQTVDFEYEKSMAVINATRHSDIRTVFLTPPQQWENVSSSLIRGLTTQPGWESWVAPYVTPEVMAIISDVVSSQKKSS